MKKLFVLFAFIVTSSTPHLHAQENTTKKRSGVTLRFLPVGQQPLLKILRDGNGQPKEADPPAGSLPPNHLLLKTQSKDGKPADQEDSRQTKILTSLCRISNPVTHRGKKKVFAIYEEKSSTPYAKFQLPEDTRNGLVILYKNIRQRTWDKPSVIALSNNTNAFPAQSVRVVNASSWVTAVKLQGFKPFKLKPSQSKVLRLPKAKANYSYAIAIESPKTQELRKVDQYFLNLQQGERSNLVIYDFPRDKRKLTKVQQFRNSDLSTSSR